MNREVFLILDPGPMTTVQDSGRYGFRKYGAPVSGALDRFSFFVANRLVGNQNSGPALELTYIGLKIQILSDCVIALTGAEMTLRVNGDNKPTWSSIQVKTGDVVQVGPATKGLRGYLAVGGGIRVEPVMGSCSTFVAANMGGFKGRALAKGDRLEAGLTDRNFRPATFKPEWRPKFTDNVILRSIPGPQDDFFEDADQTFFSSEYVCSPKADRMGIRLQGPQILFKDNTQTTIISEPILTGCVQVPPDAQPIILLVEQTVGGYAKITTVIGADLDLLAQLKPGAVVKFEKITIEKAHNAFRNYRARLESILSDSE